MAETYFDKVKRKRQEIQAEVKRKNPDAYTTPTKTTTTTTTKNTYTPEEEEKIINNIKRGLSERPALTTEQSNRFPSLPGFNAFEKEEVKSPVYAQPNKVKITPEMIENAKIKNSEILPVKESKWTTLGKEIYSGLMSGAAAFNKGLDWLVPEEIIPENPLEKYFDRSAYTGDYYENEAIKSEKRSGFNPTVGMLTRSTAEAVPQLLAALGTAGQSGVSSLAPSFIEGASKLSSAANTALTISQNLIKNPSYWTSFIGTVGTDFEEAKKAGMSDLKAQAYAILNSALNAGVEVGGGIENLAKEKGIKTTKEIVLDWVKSSGEEALEEITQGVITNINKSAFQGKIPELFSLQNEDAIINPKRMGMEALGGFVVGGILGAPVTGMNVVSNSIANRQNRIVEYENLGKRIVEKDLLKPLIEEGLKEQKNSKIYKEAEKLQKAGSQATLRQVGKLYNDILSAKKQTSGNSVSNISSQEEQATPNSSIKAQPTPQIKTTPQPTKTNIPMSEPFNEEVRQFGETLGENGRRFLYGQYKGQVDFADFKNGFSLFYDAGMSGIPYNTATKYLTDETKRAFPDIYSEIAYEKGMQDAVKPGTVTGRAVNELEKTSFKILENFAKRTNSAVVVEHGLTDENGDVIMGDEKDGVIRINADFKDVAHIISTHEFTHRMEKLAPKAYGKFKDYVVAKMKKDGTYDSAMNVLREEYKGVNDEKLHDELCATFAEKLFNSEAELTDLIKTDRTLAERIKDIWLQILDFLGKTDEKTHAQLMWKKCLKEAEKSKSKIVNTGEVRYRHAGETKSGIKKYVTDFPADMDSGARKKVFEKRIATIFNLGAIKLNTDTKKIQIMGDKFVSEKNLYGDEKSSDLEMDAKINSLYDIAEILSESKFIGKEIEPSFKDAEVKPKNKAHKGVKYWYYFKNTIYMDNVLYDVFFDIRDKGKEQYQYSIRFVGKNRVTRSGHTVDNNLRRKTNESPSMTRVSQNEDSVNTYSMQNSANNSESNQMRPGVSEKLDEYINEFGQMKKGAEPRRDVAVPKRTEEGTKVRRTARTAAEALSLSDEFSNKTLENIVEGRLNYIPVSNESALNYAHNYIYEHGIEEAEKEVNSAINQHTLDKNKTALAEILLQTYDRAGDFEKAQELIMDFAAEATRMGQTIQAISMLKKLDGSYEAAYVDKIIKKLEKDIFEKSKGKKKVKIEVSKELMEKLKKAKTKKERLAIKEEIFVEIAKQLPKNWVDVWNSWRFFAMLANVRTHVRNTIGNGFFMPMIAVKNVTAKISETIGYAASGGKMKRSKTFIVPKEYKEFADADAIEMREILSGGGKYNPADIIRDKQKKFWGLLEWLRIKNEQALETEDWLFLKHHYKVALSNYLAANKVDLNNISKTTLRKARSRAIEEAQRNTFRDLSEFANALNKFSRTNKATALIVEGVTPFKKTPINILKRGVEYSPAGLVKTLFYDSWKIHEGEITASEWIDTLSRGLTGTAVVALGMLFKSLGVIEGAAGDEKEKEFEELQGHQNYSVNLYGHTYTLDWLAPAALPLFVGVEIMSAMESEEKIGFRMALNALANITEPMFEMSMLQSLTGAITATRGASGSEIAAEIGSTIIKNYFGQAVPTIFGQLARTIDDTRRTTYDDKNVDIPGGLQYAGQSFMRKIPGLSKTLQPYVDNWGRKEVTEGIFKRALSNFLSPGYYSKIETSDMEKELMRLYDEVGDEENISLFPKRAVKSFELDDETQKQLTAKEFTLMQETQGQSAYKMLTDILNGGVYKENDDIIRGKIVTKVYSLSKALAKKAVAGEKWTGEKWIEEAISLVDGDDYSAAEDYLIYCTLKDDEALGRKGAHSLAFDKLKNIPEETWLGELTESQTEKYNEYIKNSGIDISVYVEAKDYKGKLETINKDTPEEKTPKEQMTEYINGLNLTRAQKRALYLSFGYSAKNCPF